MLDKENFNKQTPEQSQLVEELRQETGIDRSVIKKIGKSSTLKEALKILLLTVGLTLTSVEAQAQQIEGNSKQLDKQEQLKNEVDEKMELVQSQFIEMVKKLQRAGIVVYHNREKMGIESSADGQIGKYNIEVFFHHYDSGQKEGEITGQDNERITLTFSDKNGADYYIENFFGKFSGYALSWTPQPGFEEKTRDFMFKNKGIILGRRGVNKIYYKELSPDEIQEILKDIEHQAESEKK